MKKYPEVKKFLDKGKIISMCRAKGGPRWRPKLRIEQLLWWIRTAMPKSKYWFNQKTY